MCAAIAAAGVTARLAVLLAFRLAVWHRDGIAANVADDFDRQLGQAFDVAQLSAFAWIAQRNRNTAFTLAGGAADAVNISLSVQRHLEVDDVRDVGNVDTARCNIGCNENADVSGREIAERALAGSLRFVAVHGGRANAGHGETIGDAVGAALGPAEHDHALAGFISKDRVQTALLFRRPDHHHLLRDAIDDHRLRRQVDANGIGQQFIGELADFRRHRGRQQSRAALMRQQADDLADIADEAHVEHPVGFVDDECHRGAQIGVTAVDVIQQTARRGDEHVHAALQSINLRAFGHATEHDGAADVHEARKCCDFSVDLDGEFACWRQDQRADHAWLQNHFGFGHRVEDRQHEGSRFARAGFGKSHQIAVGELGWHTLRLDWRRRVVFTRLEGTRQRLGKAERLESIVCQVEDFPRASECRRRFGLYGSVPWPTPALSGCGLFYSDCSGCRAHARWLAALEVALGSERHRSATWCLCAGFAWDVKKMRWPPAPLPQWSSADSAFMPLTSGTGKLRRRRHRRLRRAALSSGRDYGRPT